MGPKIKMSSLEDSDNDIQQQIPQAPGGRDRDDLGSHELKDGQRLKQMIRVNAEQAGVFIGRINAAK